MNKSLAETILSFGFPVDRARLIHAFVGGSALHGVKLEGTDDTDIYGIYIEHSDQILGLDVFEHFVTSTAAQAERNQPHDIDIACYSVRKWASLAAKGNPTVLQFLFAPVFTRGQAGSTAEDLAWSEILGSRSLFLAKAQHKQYLGYADAQLHRMTGERGRGKHGQRPELESKFGYDTKAAMHTLRLLHEGIELMKTGYITLPRQDPEKSKLLCVRKGEWSEDRVISEANRMRQELKEAASESNLPDSIDRREISFLISKIYRAVWAGE